MIIVKASTVSMYADDTSLTLQSQDISQLNETINDDLRRLDLWMQGNKLSLNVSKTQSMLICTKPKRQKLKMAGGNLCLNIRGNDLDVMQKVKYLGVQVDDSLDWKDQIKAISSKVSKALGLLKHAKKFLPASSLRSLYLSIVDPHFRYFCSVWGCCGSSTLLQLQKLQNRAARILTNSAFDAPSSPLIRSLGWMTIADLISFESKQLVFKSLNNQAPQYICKLFQRNSECSSRDLRNTATDLRLPMSTSLNGQKRFSYRGAKLWNNLAFEVKQAPSLPVFKRRLLINKNSN